MNRSLAKLAPFSLIMLVGFLAYANSFQNSFHFDDRLYITNNPAIRELGNIKAMWNYFPSHSRFIPLVSFALNYHFHGLEVFGYHLVNVLIHIANGLLVWCMGRMLMKGRDNGNAIALAAALIFIAHPVQTQAVTYIAQRMASMAAFFYLLSCCLYIAGRRAQRRSLAVTAWAGSFLAAVAGMFTKEIVLTVPLVLIGIELIFLRPAQDTKNMPRRTRLLAAGLAALLLSIVPAMFSFRIWDALSSTHESKSHAAELITPEKYIITQWRVQAKYVTLLLAPVGQNLDHDFPLSHALTEPAVLASAALLLALGLLAVAALLSGRRIIGFGIIWFFIALLPEYVPRPHLIFEHKIYLPSVGFCIALAAGLHQLIRGPKSYAAAMTLIVLALSVLTFQRNKVWKDDITLWQDAAAKSPLKASAHHNLGVAYARSGHHGPAIKEFDEALRLEPSLLQALNYRGTVHEEQGRVELALQDYNAVLRVNPVHTDALYNKALVLQKRGETEEALKLYAKALQEKPDHAAALNNRSGIYIDRKQYDLAIQDMTQALAIDPYALTIYMNRARLYRIAGRLEEALKDYDRVLKLAPSHLNALALRAQTFFELDRLEEAKRDILKIQELRKNQRPRTK